MPRLRRRRILAGATASIGTLLADLKADQQKAEYDTRKAEAEKKEKAGGRSRRYVRIVQNYVKDGNATFDETEAALKEALTSEDDGELKELLKDYLSDVRITKQAKEINNLVDDYTYGRRGYDSFKSALSAIKPNNDIAQSAIAKHLDAARKIENQKLLSRWSSEYKSGELRYESLVKNLEGLRSSPDQKDPNEIAQITSMMSQAAENEQQIEDNKQYVSWQQSGDSTAALRYFNQRLVNAKTAKDANTVEQYVKSIQASDQQQAKTSASNWEREANSMAKSVFDEMSGLLKMAVAEAKSPEDVIAAYQEFGTFLAGGDANGRKYPGLLNSGAPITKQYKVELETLNQKAALDASKVASKMFDDELAELQRQLSISGLDEKAKMSIWQEIGKKARSAMNSEWLMSGQEKYGGWIDKAATAVASMVRTSAEKRAETDLKISEGLSELYRTAKTMAQAGALELPKEALENEEGFANWATGRRLPALVDQLKRYKLSTSTQVGQDSAGTFRGTPKDGMPKLTISESITSGALDDLPNLMKQREDLTRSSVQGLLGLRGIQDQKTTEEEAYISLGWEPPTRPNSPAVMDMESRRLGIASQMGQEGPKFDPLLVQPTITPTSFPRPFEFGETAQYLMQSYGIQPMNWMGQSADAERSRMRGGAQDDMGESAMGQDALRSRTRGGEQIE